MKATDLKDRLFSITSRQDFCNLALDIFQFQYENQPIYRQFCEALNRKPKQIKRIEDIPFLPIQFFKSHQILASNFSYQEIFTSSGTTGSQTSKHFIADLDIYEQSFKQTFKKFYGNIEDFIVLALLPSYLERTGSSLIYMAQDFIKNSKSQESGFYLNNYDELIEKLKFLDKQNRKVLLMGVSFALLDLIEKENFSLKNTIVMETGGMKGRRKEITRTALHSTLKQGFGVENIHSEYGMTELLSQAYSKADGLFFCPPTMDILIREPEDPFQILNFERTGGLNIIDLANIYSCSFIATQDLGKKHADGGFEVLGRFDESDIRGCNLMYA